MTLQDAIALINNNDITNKSAARWADLGCGSGLFTYALANLLQKGSTVYAADKSPVILQPQRNPNKIHINSLLMDFTKEPFPFDRLDGILMANSLHYVADKIDFIAGIEKQLASHGVFVIVEYDTDKANKWVPYPASCKTLKTIFSRAGYNSFSKLHELPSIYNSSHIYAALIKK
ncbi:MAG: class I SAM-dependent methyltransferase [Chitinophagaceae bacterium]